MIINPHIEMNGCMACLSITEEMFCVFTQGGYPGGMGGGMGVRKNHIIIYYAFL